MDRSASGRHLESPVTSKSRVLHRLELVCLLRSGRPWAVTPSREKKKPTSQVKELGGQGWGTSRFSLSTVRAKVEKGVATHCSVLTWRIPRTEEPGGLQSTGSQRVGHDQVTELNSKEGSRNLRPSNCSVGSPGIRWDLH